MVAHFIEDVDPLCKQSLWLKVTASALLETVFGKLKNKLCDGVPVRVRYPDKTIVVETDPNVFAVGEV